MGKHFIGYILSLIPNCYRSIVHTLVAVNVKPAVIHINPERWGQKYDLRQNNRFPSAFFRYNFLPTSAVRSESYQIFSI